MHILLANGVPFLYKSGIVSVGASIANFETLSNLGLSFSSQGGRLIVVDQQEDEMAGQVSKHFPSWAHKCLVQVAGLVGHLVMTAKSLAGGHVV